jgi:hypothetical protein
MTSVETLRVHAAQARRFAPSDARLRTVLELLAREIEDKIASIERQQEPRDADLSTA